MSFWVEKFPRFNIRFLLLLFLAILPLVNSCGNKGETAITGKGNTTSATVVSLQSIALTPGSATIGKAATQQYIATGSYSDGTVEYINGLVTWVAGNPSVATVDGSGIVYCVDAGTSSITARLGNVSGSTTITVFSNEWIWMNGSNIAKQKGVYGTLGKGTVNNIPGARIRGVTWTDGNGNLWLFGGNGYDSTGSSGELNDLWKFDGTNWTWVSGSNIVNQKGIYGTQGTADSNNIPGGRAYGISWIDGSGNLWLFGGIGYDSAGTDSYLNDLWKFDGTNWTWVSGSNIVNQKGVYGTQGVSTGTNIPGSRAGANSWIDRNGNLWLFGGLGSDSTGTFTYGHLNDLWKFDGTNWTWVSGSNIAFQQGVYGLEGVAAETNNLGARWGAVSWTDRSGNFWLFGGIGYDSTGGFGKLNDLWKFDGTNWTWVSGSNIVNQQGVYGIQGTAASNNIPGARFFAVSWTYAGFLWLFGGEGVDSARNIGYLNDLWKFDGSNWTWVSGGDIVNQQGISGTEGIPSGINIPGARAFGVTWTDSNENLWLFGGVGYDSSGTGGFLNDFWRYHH